MNQWSSQVTTCVHCGEKYDLTSLGSLSCAIHPLQHNDEVDGRTYGIGHYDCCGASYAEYDVTHYEHGNPKGCHAIDHTSSVEERDRLKIRPFSCVSYKGVKRLSVVQTWPHGKDQYVMPITMEGMLNGSYPFRLASGAMYYINLSEEHDGLLQKVNAVIQERMKSVQSYENSTARFYDNENEVGVHGTGGGTKEFHPFYIIRRMDFQPKPGKWEEARAYSPCSITYL